MDGRVYNASFSFHRATEKKKVNKSASQRKRGKKSRRRGFIRENNRLAVLLQRTDAKGRGRSENKRIKQRSQLAEPPC